MVINIANVRDIGAEVLYQCSKFASGLKGINGVRSEAGTANKALCALEIPPRYKITIVRSGIASRVGHREQRGFMSSLPHHVHGRKEVSLSAAEGEVIFVAVQDSHELAPVQPQTLLAVQFPPATRRSSPTATGWCGCRSEERRVGKECRSRRPPYH